VQALAELVHLEGMALGDLGGVCAGGFGRSRGFGILGRAQDQGVNGVVHPGIFADLAPSGESMAEIAG
jgi:hypothetical protein